jgi:hypothetical protein
MALPLLLVALFRYPRLTIAAILVFIGLLAVDTIVEEWGPAASAKPGRPRQERAAPARPGPANRTARADIPARYLTLYQRGARACPGLRWQVLAGIGKAESDHGRSRLRGVRSGWNSAGAAGPMQFGIGKGRAGNAWARFGRGGNVYDPADAIPASARYLCAHGAPADIPGAILAYNHSSSYVASVLGHARRYGGR